MKRLISSSTHPKKEVKGILHMEPWLLGLHNLDVGGQNHPLKHLPSDLVAPKPESRALGPMIRLN